MVRPFCLSVVFGRLKKIEAIIAAIASIFTCIFHCLSKTQAFITAIAVILPSIFEGAYNIYQYQR